MVAFTNSVLIFLIILIAFAICAAVGIVLGIFASNKKEAKKSKDSKVTDK